mmetsp:Transcript_7627/g.15522  ORF Transcript_7627/g.15522 Transcript_7627/m.15522 type:complete len:237 (+) Transcript_7627:288-998(+)
MQDADKQTFRGQSDSLTCSHATRLRLVLRGGDRGGREDRGDRRPEPGEVHPEVQAGGVRGGAQVRGREARAHRGAPWRGHHQHGRLRVCGPPRRGGRRELGAAAGGCPPLADPVRGVGGGRGRQAAGGGAGPGRGGREHGHSLHGDGGSPHSPRHQTGAGGGERNEHNAGHALTQKHGARVQQCSGPGGAEDRGQGPREHPRHPPPGQRRELPQVLPRDGRRAEQRVVRGVRDGSH